MNLPEYLHALETAIERYTEEHDEAIARLRKELSIAREQFFEDQPAEKVTRER